MDFSPTTFPEELCLMDKVLHSAALPSNGQSVSVLIVKGVYKYDYFEKKMTSSIL